MIQVKAVCASALKRQLHEGIWGLIASQGGGTATEGAVAGDDDEYRPDALSYKLNVHGCLAGATSFSLDAGLLYSVDRQPSSFRPDEMAAASDSDEFPPVAYDLNPIDCAPPSGSAPNLALTACWNCGDQGHSMRDCSEAYNPDNVRENRRKFEEARGPQGGGNKDQRYHDEDGLSAAAELAKAFPHVVPGRISSALRTALGIAPGEPPPWLSSMRRHGYPPGYLQPAPHPASERHWSYGANGELSALIAEHDSGYQAVWPHSQAGVDRAGRVAAEKEARQSVQMIGGGTGLDGEEGSGAAEAVAQKGSATGDPAVPAASPPTPSSTVDEPLASGGLFDAPLSVGLRLTPFFPACSCGRQPSVPLPGLNVEYDPQVHNAPDEEDKEEGSEAAAGGGDSDGMSVEGGGDEGEHGKAQRPAKRARTAAATPSTSKSFKWPRPIVEPDYCPVHRSRGAVQPTQIVASPAAVPATPSTSSAANVPPPSSSSGAANDNVEMDGVTPAKADESSAAGVAADELDDDADGTGKSRRRLSRFLTPRDREALQAAIAAGAGSWYQYIGGSAEPSENYLISDDLKGRGSRSGDDSDSGSEEESTVSGANVFANKAAMDIEGATAPEGLEAKER